MVISIVLILIVTYLACGLLFAIPFVIKGVDKLDEAANGGSIGFHIIIIPGVMVFWPLLLKKWMNNAKHPTRST